MAVPNRLNTLSWRQAGFPWKRPASLDGKAPLTGLHPLQCTSSVIIGRLPSQGHAKASLNPEETRKLKLHFVESSPFSAGRMSIASRLNECCTRSDPVLETLQREVLVG
jgi:hypothetical protein